jgi:hypothetical protein
MVIVSHAILGTDLALGVHLTTKMMLNEKGNFLRLFVPEFNGHW